MLSAIVGTFFILSIGMLTAIALGGFVALWWPWNVRLPASPAPVP